MKPTGTTTTYEAHRIVYLNDKKRELQAKVVQLRQELQEVNLKLNDIDDELSLIQNG